MKSWLAWSVQVTSFLFVFFLDELIFKDGRHHMKEDAHDIRDDVQVGIHRIMLLDTLKPAERHPWMLPVVSGNWGCLCFTKKWFSM